MTELERIERLEKLYERWYHTYQELAIYIPRMCDFLDKYFSKSREYRYDIASDINCIRELVKMIDNDMQEHFKSHTDKKRVYNKYIP